MLLRQTSSPRGRANAAGPLPARTRLNRFPPSRFALDSTPQGAAVTADATTPGAAPRRLGETPLVQRQPRGETAVALTLTKEGFAPLPFKIVPNRDKEVVAPMERATSTPVADAEARPKRRAGSATARRSSSVAPAPLARTAAAPGTLATVRFRDDSGDGFQLLEARFIMDDHPLPVMTGGPRAENTVIYTGRVRPGRHVVSARLVYQGRNRGPFTYLSGYKLNVESREVVHVPADRPANFTIATEKTKGMNVPLEKQLAVTVRDDYSPHAAR